MKAAKRKQIFSEINITPLTDIFLVLLIIMMVVAPMLNTSGLKLSVPTTAPSQDVKEDPKTLNLVITAGGEYQIDGAPINRLTLSSKLTELKAQFPDGLLIKTSPDSSHEVLTYAMDAAQSAKIDKVAVTADEGGAPPQNP